MHGSVRRTADFERIAALPNRDPYHAELVPRLTTALQSPGGTDQLREVQARALYDAHRCNGLFAPIKVGGGKTLVSFTAPIVLQANRPVLLLPASLIEKTERDRERYAKHFKVARHLRFLSYEKLGRVGCAEELHRYRPDLIIADECHRLKNKRAACTRRVARYMHDYPETRFVALSGTIMKHSIKDFAHILRWCLKERAPVPLDDNELDDWSCALDDLANPLARMDPGPMGDTIEEARAWFRSRLESISGVVIYESKDTDASLRVSALPYEVAPVTEQAFKKLREEWATPTGYTFSEAIMLWKFARELSLGHWIEWEPHAPEEWLQARKDWAHFVRSTLARSRTYDSELQVRLAVKNGDLQDEEDTLTRWEKIKDSFTPNPFDRWHDDSAIRACADWAKQNKSGIIFTGHSFFGRRLAKEIGAPYYGAEGKSDAGFPIENEDGSRIVVASLQANGTGRNLQVFNRALVTTNVNGGDALEQLIGRLHRQGQLADEVEFTFLVGCFEHVDGFWRAYESTQTLADLTGGNYKLTFADITFPVRDSLPKTGFRWKKQ